MTENRQTRTQSRAQTRSQKRQKNTEKKPFKIWLKRILLSLAILFIVLFVGGIGLFAYYASGAPELDEEKLKAPISAEFYDMNGEMFAKFGPENRKYINYEDIPKQMVDAIIATEDSRFFDHFGLDLRRLGGAVIANVTGGFGSQGGSTITQQVVKNYLLSDEKTLKRKAQEAWLAIQLERNFEKEEIFEMYFNKVLMSGRIYGFGTAAEHFFGKELDELELDEMALLAGMPQSPNNYNPFKNPELAQKRRDIVLDLMVRHDKITEEQAKEAKSIDVASRVLPEEVRQTTTNTKYDAFLDVVLEEIESKGIGGSITDGIKVYTTLDPDAQSTVESVLNNPENFPTEKQQAGISVIDTKTGAIRAIGGGRNYDATRPFNYADDLKDRHPGSTIKPLIDYGPAIEYLKWSTGKKTVDERMTYTNSSQVINNADNQYLGTMTIRKALYASRNIPAVKTLNEVGFDKAEEFLSRLGIETDYIVESDAIGGGRINLSPIQLSASYAAFGNNGVYNEPYSIREIVYLDGSKKTFKPDPVVAMSDYTAYMVTDMLRDVVSNKSYATGKYAQVPGVDIAGKTGTTNYGADEYSRFNLPKSSVPDSWFVGYSPNYSIAIWSGYSKRSEPITTWDERRVPQKLFSKIMSQISSGKENTRFVKPSSVVEATIEVGTEPLKLASGSTPSHLRSTELFVKGTEPKSVVENKEEEITLNAPTNLKASYDAEAKTVNLTWDFKLSKDIEASEKDVSFEVSMTDGKKSKTLGNTKDTNYTVSDIEEGNNYTFSVVAVIKDTKSSPASVSIYIEKQIEEPEVDEPEVDDETETKPNTETEEEKPKDDGKNNNNNGNPSDNKNNNGNDGKKDNEQPKDNTGGGEVENPNDNTGDEEGSNTDGGNQTPTPPSNPPTPTTPSQSNKEES